MHSFKLRLTCLPRLCFSVSNLFIFSPLYRTAIEELPPLSLSHDSRHRPVNMSSVTLDEINSLVKTLSTSVVPIVILVKNNVIHSMLSSVLDVSSISSPKSYLFYYYAESLGDFLVLIQSKLLNRCVRGLFLYG